MKKLQLLLVTILVMVSVASFTTTTKDPEVIPTSTAVPTTISHIDPISSVTPEPEVATQEPVIEPRYGFTDDEVYLLAQLLCGSSSIDGDGEYDFVWTAKYDPDNINYCEISKVLCVVMNRVRSEQFPNTVSEVVLQKGQFSPMPKNAKKTPDDIAIQKVQEWCDAYDNWDTGVQNVPEDHLYFHAGPHLTNVTY